MNRKREHLRDSRQLSCGGPYHAFRCFRHGPQLLAQMEAHLEGTSGTHSLAPCVAHSCLISLLRNPAVTSPFLPSYLTWATKVRMKVSCSQVVSWSHSGSNFWSAPATSAGSADGESGARSCSSRRR